MVQLDGTSLHQDAPARGVGGIDAVDLVADCRAAQETPQLGAGVRAEHDRVAVHDVVHREDLRSAVVEDADAPHGRGGEPIPALDGAEVLEPGSAVDRRHGAFSSVLPTRSWSVRSPSGRGERPAWPGTFGPAGPSP